MKVICINKNKGHLDDYDSNDKTMSLVNSYYSDKLTIGKIYEILTYDDVDDVEPFKHYFITDDGSELLYFDNDKDFITLEQWREQQLNKIVYESRR
jgi:hypothetical protein